MRIPVKDKREEKRLRQKEEKDGEKHQDNTLSTSDLST